MTADLDRKEPRKPFLRRPTDDGPGLAATKARACCSPTKKPEEALAPVAGKCLREFALNGHGRGGFRHGVRLAAFIAKRHESGQDENRRAQHDDNTEVHHLGPFRILRRSRAETHHALRKSARSQQRRERHRPFHWILIFIDRSESGMKIMSIRM